MKILNITQTCRWKEGTGVYSVLHTSLSHINKISGVCSELLLLSNVRESQEVECNYKIYHLDDFDWSELQSYDVIYYHGFYNVLMFKILRLTKKYKIPFVIKAHGAFMRNCIYANGIKSFFKKTLFICIIVALFRKVIEGIVFINRSEEQNSIRIQGVKIYYEHNALAFKNYDLEKKNISKSVEFLFFSRIIPSKGIWKLIDAFKTRPHLSLSIVGSCTKQIECKLLKKIEGLPNITYLGAIYDEVGKKRIFHSTDVYILPSYNEGFPTTVLESLHYETPVVVTEECNCEEIVQAGYAFSLGNASDMNWNILDIIARNLLHKIRNEKYKEKCNEFIKEKYSIDSVYRETLELYENILSFK
ncbi:glycosyltransferase family 4 protein [Bacteroides sp. 51]|uniref:glycosyltransferase family 4 protein n=1 Tax=Bacteroides sp. 51 TaxID=2302938 RepID=UPI0013D2BAD4|nr:glycosyltransferase family 4 protein [Bacteroides sp. 51]NDV84914.1 glycosyltransferase [Bacteroides sp. 51]